MVELANPSRHNPHRTCAMSSRPAGRHRSSAIPALQTKGTGLNLPPVTAPPHRSTHEEFPHTAPTSSLWRQPMFFQSFFQGRQNFCPFVHRYLEYYITIRLPGGTHYWYPTIHLPCTVLIQRFIIDQDSFPRSPDSRMESIRTCQVPRRHQSNRRLAIYAICYIDESFASPLLYCKRLHILYSPPILIDAFRPCFADPISSTNRRLLDALKRRCARPEPVIPAVINSKTSLLVFISSSSRLMDGLFDADLLQGSGEALTDAD